MTYQTDEILLSLEELAVVLSLIGQPEVAKGLLLANLGEISPDEEKGRLLAANHTLMAKQVLSIKDDQPVLQEALAEVAGALVKQRFLLRFSYTNRGLEHVLAYYFQHDFAVEHQIYYGVVHHFRKLTDPEKVLEAGIAFLGLEGVESFVSPEAELPQQTLEQAREQAVESPEQAQRLLEQAGVPSPVDKLLAEDLHGDARRGTVLRVEESEEGLPRSDRGYLLLKGDSGRAWVFTVFLRGEEPFVKVRAFDSSDFKALLRALLI